MSADYGMFKPGDYGIFENDLGVTGDLYRQQQRIADLERELAEARKENAGNSAVLVREAGGHIIATVSRDSVDTELAPVGRIAELNASVEAARTLVVVLRERIAELECALIGATDEREQLRLRADRAEADFAAAQKIAEGYEQRLTQSVALADKAVARAERAEAAGANLGRRLVKVQDELGCAYADAEAESALLDWQQSKLNRGDWHIDFSHPDEIDIRVAIRRAMAAELGEAKT